MPGLRVANAPQATPDVVAAVAGWFGATRKYRCLFCGYEFLEHVHASERAQKADE